ncbi:MAG: HAMP domain-containing sensor histidine kinase [Sulfuricurvum sp.]|nr:HAMP domain-containing sensor histidine kinase [Sulfuricurvum sp.]
MDDIWLAGYLALSIVMIIGMYAYGKRRLFDEISSKQSAIDELTTLQKQQNFFIQKMIHEMNTPLSAIELNLSVLSKECPNSRNVDMIKGSARILATIYDDIAFVARKEKMCHLPQWIDLGEFIADRILYFDAMTVVKEMLVEIDIDEGYHVHMSPTELQRVVDNNLSNAIKYTLQKGQVISIFISYQDEALYLTFKDNGIGMTDDDLQKLFEAYYRGHSDQHGLGLGMSIVKDICDDYNISINVKSVRGEGSSFIYHFPKEMVRQTLVKQ